MSTNEPYSLLATLNKLESLRSTSQSQGSRKFHRFVVRGDGELYPVDQASLDRAPVQVALRDIGGGGIGFIACQPFEPGAVWRIGFLSKGYVINQQATIVRHCQLVQDDVYLIGGQFCIEPGLMVCMGVAPSLVEGDAAITQPGQDSFLAPGEVA